MCIEDDIEKVDKRVGHCGSIYKRVEDPDVLIPCKYHKNVWVFWWCYPYLHNTRGGYRWPVVSSVEEILTNDRGEGGWYYEAGMWGCQWDSYFENYS